MNAPQAKIFQILLFKLRMDARWDNLPLRNRNIPPPHPLKWKFSDLPLKLKTSKFQFRTMQCSHIIITIPFENTRQPLVFRRFQGVSNGNVGYKWVRKSLPEKKPPQWGREWEVSGKEWFWPFEPFSKAKATFCKCWISIKIKISMTCLYKEYSVKMKMVSEQWLQLVGESGDKNLLGGWANFWLE